MSFISLGMAIIPRKKINKGYAKFWGANKVYYGRGANGKVRLQKIILMKIIWRLCVWLIQIWFSSLQSYHVTLQNAVKFSELHRSFTSLNPFTPEPPVTVHADQYPFFCHWSHHFYGHRQLWHLTYVGERDLQTIPKWALFSRKCWRKMQNEKQLKSNLKGEKAKGKSKEFNVTSKCSWNL